MTIKLNAPVLRKKIIPLILLLVLSKLSFSQLTVDTIDTAQQLVNTIVGPDYTVSNVKINCATLAIGTFTGTSNVGFEKGIVLTTGLATSAKGPNDKTNAGRNLNRSGDLQLDTLTGSETFDGCAIEFDFIPTCDTLKINYVFGSEEYPEYATKSFTDVLAFFVSGPGITGTRNIATVPGTTLPVSVNSINATTNSQYYVSNTSGTSIQYDGFTTPLIATQSVVPHSTYHLKIVIADGTDAIYDSGIFIKAGSITCSPFVGMKENQLDISTLIYPNPAHQLIYIQSPVHLNKNLRASIYSVQGKLISEETYFNRNQPYPLNLSGIEASGIYFLKLQSGNETITRKIIIHR